MNAGPMYLRDARDIDVFPSAVATFLMDGARLIVYDGKRAYVSPQNLEWMKTADPVELGDMRVMRVTDAHTKGWLPKAPKLESFRYAP